MSKRGKARRAQALAEAELRMANGKASMKDLDFIGRMTALNGGRDPYTNQPINGARQDNNPVGLGMTKRQSEMFHFHTNTYKPSPMASREDGVFHCAETSELTKECPIAKVPEIYFNQRQWDILLHCTEEYNTEWIALLLGELGEVNSKPTYIIKDFYFPPQTASGTHVDVPIEVRPKPGTIGAIHSHVGMQVFFSGTDVAHSNWPVEIVINRKHEYKAVARHQLKCGEWAKNDAKVFVTGTILPAAIKAQLDLAFAQGEQIEKSKKKGKGKGTTITIPAGIAAEDKAEVAASIGQGNTSIVPSSQDMDYFHDRLPHEPACPETGCMREKGHFGWHRDANKHHFLSKADQEREDAVVRDQIEKDRLSTEATNSSKPATEAPSGASGASGAKELKPVEDNEDLSFPFGGRDTATSQIGADIPDDMEAEDYCINCHGTGFDTFESGFKTITICCRSCKGSGLSGVGLQKIREGVGLT